MCNDVLMNPFDVICTSFIYIYVKMNRKAEGTAR